MLFSFGLFLFCFCIASLVYSKIPDDAEEDDVGAEKPTMRTKVFF